MKAARRIPRWLCSLQEQVRPDGPAAHLPPWEDSLWAPTARQAPQRLVLRGTLHFPATAGPSELRSQEGQLSCLLEEPVVWSAETRGIHLVLLDGATQSRATALLLTPSAFSILQSGPSWGEADVPIFSLAAPPFVLELPGVRGEFAVQEETHDAAQPETPVLRSLALMATIWKY